jgi:DnaJ like chaperone protein
LSWWGKVVGGTLGFMLGGPLGALLGASLGHSLDSSLSGARIDGYLPGDQERTQAAFFTATFSVMGYLAKADGRVSAEEIRLAEELMGEMQLDELQRTAARALFNKGKEPEFDLGLVLDQFRTECHRRRTLIQMFLELQVQAAFADGILDPAENSILEDMAHQLGFRQADLRTLIEMVRAMRSGTGAGPASRSRPASDPYKVLGVSRDTPLPEIKKAYRRLLSQHHPDKLVSKGLPEEMIKLANQKTHEISEAWQEIQERHKT